MVAQMLGKCTGVDAEQSGDTFIPQPLVQWFTGQPVAVVECIVLSHDGTAMDAGTFKVPAQTGCAILRRNAVIA